MYVPRRQRGITFLGWMAILLLAISAGYVGIQIGPPYANYITLVGVVESVHEDRGLRDSPEADIRRALNTRMRLNEVDDLRDVVTMRQPGGDVAFDIDYEVEKPLIGNVHLLLKFKKRIGF